MPLQGVRYRMTPSHVRLAFRGQKVVEAKNMKTGDIHTEEEFNKDEVRKSDGYKKVMHALTGKKPSS